MQNLSILFATQKGVEILKGNIDEFIRFKISEDYNYTFDILKKQALEAGSRAWDAKEYKDFVKNIDKIGIDNVPPSYQLKYKFVKKNL